jgi:hypothetical protein
MQALVALTQAKLSNLQAALVSVVVSGASIAFSFGVLSQTKEQVIISAAGTLIGAGVQIYAALEQ